MSTERPTSNAVRDSRVSRSYRELASERTPASLNETVLRQAARAAGKAYSGNIRWLKPAAWAATIFLSLAAVMQLSQIPQPERITPAAPANTYDTAFHRDDAPLLEQAENLAKMRSEVDDDQPAEGLASRYASGAFEARSVCDPEVQDDPQEWLECTESLDSRGLHDAASEQRRLIAERYPDFEIPKD